MTKNKTIFSHMVRRAFQLSVICLFGFLAQCSKEEPPAPKTEAPKPAVVEQDKSTSKETAEDPGVTGSSGQVKVEEKVKEEDKTKE